MATIVPAILESDPDYLEDRISQAMKIQDASRFQIDFSDDKFAPYPTVSISDMPILNPEFEWEAHLMVENPQDYFLDAKIAGFTTVVFHYEAVAQNKLAEFAGQLRELGIAPGLGLNPETPVGDVSPYFQFFSQILLLSVYPGKQGQEMLPETLDRLKELKEFGANIKIEVDGGVNKENIAEVADAGADFIVAGSAIFKSEMVEQGLDDGFENMAERNYEELLSRLS